MFLKKLLPILKLEYEENAVFSEEDIERHINIAIDNFCPERDSFREDDVLKIKRLIEQLRYYVPSIQTEALSMVEKKLEPIIGIRSDIQTKIPLFKKFLQEIDIKTKFYFLVLTELRCLWGVNIDCFEKGITETLLNDEVVIAIKNTPEYSNDKTLKFLCELYEQACEIQENE
jgi:hypothetical protein